MSNSENYSKNNNESDEDESNDKTEYIKGLNYTSVIPFLTEAIKEQQEIIKKLEDRITQLENN